MKNRVLKNPKSTALGVFLLGVATWAVVAGQASLAELTAFMPFCIGLIYVKDSIFKPNEE